MYTWLFILFLFVSVEPENKFNWQLYRISHKSYAVDLKVQVEHLLQVCRGSSRKASVDTGAGI